MTGWIGVDLDGTLAEYHGWQGITHIGPPIGPMVDRVKVWLAQGVDVRIFTARVGPQRFDVPEQIQVIEGAIKAWCVEHIGVPLPVTCQKDFGMLELWDDRVVRVVENTGWPCCDRDSKF